MFTKRLGPMGRVTHMREKKKKKKKNTYFVLNHGALAKREQHVCCTQYTNFQHRFYKRIFCLAFASDIYGKKRGFQKLLSRVSVY
jgi:hypothetical protein